jgi:DNA-binding response OmpR family regulator
MLVAMVHDVLVVEDEEDIAVPLMRTLEREGYEVSRVSGGAQAVSFVVDEAPAVVILDLHHQHVVHHGDEHRGRVSGW